jgi:hypothetical protein
MEVPDNCALSFRIAAKSIDRGQIPKTTNLLTYQIYPTGLSGSALLQLKGYDPSLNFERIQSHD